jgi:hypothetical protein
MLVGNATPRSKPAPHSTRDPEMVKAETSSGVALRLIPFSTGADCRTILCFRRLLHRAPALPFPSPVQRTALPDAAVAYAWEPDGIRSSAGHSRRAGCPAARQDPHPISSGRSRPLFRGRASMDISTRWHFITHGPA